MNFVGIIFDGWDYFLVVDCKRNKIYIVLFNGIYFGSYDIVVNVDGFWEINVILDGNFFKLVVFYGVGFISIYYFID